VNIAIMQHTFNPTTIGWIRGLEGRGHRVMTVIANAKEPHGGWPADMTVVLVPDRGAWVDRVGSRLLPGRRRSVYRVPDPRELRRVLRDFGTDAVIVKVYSLRNVVALIVALTLRVRRVAWIEQVPPPNLEWRLLRSLGVLPRRIFTALDARPGGIAEPLEPPSGGMPVITYAPIVPPQTDRTALLGRPVQVLTAGAFWDAENKRPFWTLEAAHEAGILDGRATFTFAGVGREDSPALVRLRSLIAEFGVEGLVDVRLNVPFAEMPSVYAEHDVLVLPSAKEQFGMVVPEAMAHGLVVVASDRVGSVGCVVPGETGELFRTDERSHLSSVLRSLIGDPDRIERMGRTARAFIEQHATPDGTAAMLERLLTENGSLMGGSLSAGPVEPLSPARSGAGTRRRR
jgi:glycosyltransferase involved in cell wall biosynthesis